MMKIRNKFLMTAFLLALGGLQAAAAATVTTSLGNATSGLVDGSTPPLLFAGSIQEAQNGQVSPFDTSYGTDGSLLFGATNFSASWIFNYGAILDPILSASLTIGIYDHDSAADGSQLDSYDIDGNDIKTPLDALFEASGGDDGMYNEYTISLLGAPLFADLADGTATVSLTLQGLGMVPTLFPLPGPNPPTVTDTNGANLIFSTLTIETGSIPAVPIPAAAPLFLSAIAAFGLYRRRVLRSQA